MSDEELDRVVSRRVEGGTSASEADERAYHAADPGEAPGSPTDATSDENGEIEESSEPTRSE